MQKEEAMSPVKTSGMTIIVIDLLRCLTQMMRITAKVKLFLASRVPAVVLGSK
jgi:hypothetical protein